MARKGENMQDRPHRRSKLLEVPDKREIVTIEMLQKIADLLPKDDIKKTAANTTKSNTPGKSNGKAWDTEKLKTYLEEHGAVIEKTKKTAI